MVRARLSPEALVLRAGSDDDARGPQPAATVEPRGPRLALQQDGSFLSRLLGHLAAGSPRRPPRPCPSS